MFTVRPCIISWKVFIYEWEIWEMLNWKWLKPWEILIFSLNKKSKSLGVRDGFIRHSISIASTVLLCHPQHGGFYPQAQFLLNSRWFPCLRHHILSHNHVEKNTSLLLRKTCPWTPLYLTGQKYITPVTGKEIEVLFKYSRLEIRVLSVRKRGSKCVCGGGGVGGKGVFGVATFSIC